MHESNKRIIVDGVDFSRLFAFPRIVTAAAAALQPSRMVIALLMVTALITFGRVWDGVTVHRVSPRGLAAGTWNTESEGASWQAMLHGAMNSYANRKATISGGDANKDLEVGAVLNEIAAGFRVQRDQKTTKEAKEAFDQQFVSTVNMIEHYRPRGAFEATARHVSGSFKAMIDGVLTLSPAVAIGAGRDLLLNTPRLLWMHQPWFGVFYGLAALVILSVGGGAISRMAACQVAGHERLSVRQAADFALDRWVRLIAAQALPLVIAVVVAGVVILLGVVMAAPVLNVIGGIMYGLVLLLGLLIALLLVGYALGFPMLVPAAACENCDPADAMQRSYSYVLTRPLHLFLYWAIALGGLAISFMLVSLLARVTLDVTAAAFGTIAGGPAMTGAGGDALRSAVVPESGIVIGAWHHHWAANAIMFWQMVVVCLVAAYVVSYHFSVSTIVYLLMRKAADGQDIEDIWRRGLVPGTLIQASAAGVDAAAIPDPDAADHPV